MSPDRQQSLQPDAVREGIGSCSRGRGSSLSRFSSGTRWEPVRKQATTTRIFCHQRIVLNNERRECVCAWVLPNPPEQVLCVSMISDSNDVPSKRIHERGHSLVCEYGTPEVESILLITHTQNPHNVHCCQ